MGRILIENANIVLPDSELEQADLLVRDGKISKVFPGGTPMSGVCSACQTEIERLDLGGDTLIPGLIDLHVHGCGGVDTMDGTVATLEYMAKALLRQGTTAFLATTMTAPSSSLEKVLAAVAMLQPSDDGAELLGIHMEGPCISPAYRGAQNMDNMSELPVSVTDMVKLLTLAPELPQAAELIKQAQAVGVILSVGHSGATYEQMQGFIEAGVRHITHAFNAMPGIHHRAPGLLTAALLDPTVSIELIADGVHIHPAVLELALRLKGPDKVILVSDGTRAVGMPDGDYDLGGQQVRLQKGRMTLPGGTIAGSAATLLDGVRFMAKEVGRPLYEAVQMATLNPAFLMGIADHVGSLEIGKEATFLRLTPDLRLKEVWVRGRLVEPGSVRAVAKTPQLL